MLRLCLCFILLFPVRAVTAEIFVGEHPLQEFVGPGSGLYEHFNYYGAGRGDCTHAYYQLMQTPVHITGTIAEGDLEKLQKLTAPFQAEQAGCPSATIVLNSTGGSFSEAVEIGRFIAQSGFATIVDSDAVCLSACVFALIGGSYRVSDFLKYELHPHVLVLKGGKIGIHQPRIRPSQRTIDVLQRLPLEERYDQAFMLSGQIWAEVLRYVAGERRNTYLLQRMLSSPQNENSFDYLDTFEEFTLANIEVLDVDAVLAAYQQTPEGPFDISIPEFVVKSAHAASLCVMTQMRLTDPYTDFSNAYVTEFPSFWIVGTPTTDVICRITKRIAERDHRTEPPHICLFGGMVFNDFDEGRLPQSIRRFSSMASGWFPSTMFRDFESVVPADTVGEEFNLVGGFIDNAIVTSAAPVDFCRLGVLDLDPLQLGAFSKQQVVSAECNTPTRMCDGAE